MIKRPHMAEAETGGTYLTILVHLRRAGLTSILSHFSRHQETINFTPPRVEQQEVLRKS